MHFTAFRHFRGQKCTHIKSAIKSLYNNFFCFFFYINTHTHTFTDCSETHIHPHPPHPLKCGWSASQQSTSAQTTSQSRDQVGCTMGGGWCSSTPPPTTPPVSKVHVRSTHQRPAPIISTKKGSPAVPLRDFLVKKKRESK